MSAFFCGEKHFNALINAAINWKITDDHKPVNKADGQRLVDILHSENIRSLCSRYDDENADHYPASVFRPNPISMSAVTILKLCSCFDYQACETDDYNETQAAKLVDDIRHYAIRKLPGYEEAPWGLD